MRYIFTGVGGAMLGVLLAQNYDWRVIIAYLSGAIGAFMFGMKVVK